MAFIPYDEGAVRRSIVTLCEAQQSGLLLASPLCFHLICRRRAEPSERPRRKGIFPQNLTQLLSAFLEATIMTCHRPSAGQQES